MLTAHTCLTLDDAPTVLAKVDDESSTEGRAAGMGQSVQPGASPRVCWVTGICDVITSHPSPAPTSASSLRALCFLPELRSLSALGAQRAAPGPVHLACCQEGTIPSPRAPCLALAARECLRGSSGSCAEPGQVMLSPIYRWVVEDWRDADHKRLLILGAQLELRRAWDFTALSTALEIGSAWEVTALPPSRPKALPEPALRAGLITTKPRPRGTKLLDANGTFCFSYFLEDFSSSWGEDLSKLTMQ